MFNSEVIGSAPLVGQNGAEGLRIITTEGVILTSGEDSKRRQNRPPLRKLTSYAGQAEKRLVLERYS